MTVVVRAGVIRGAMFRTTLSAALCCLLASCASAEKVAAESREVTVITHLQDLKQQGCRLLGRRTEVAGGHGTGSLNAREAERAIQKDAIMMGGNTVVVISTSEKYFSTYIEADVYDCAR